MENRSAFLTFKERLANRDALTPLIDEALSGKTTAEWLGILQGKVPAARRANDVEQALENPFVRDRGRIAAADAGRAFGRHAGDADPRNRRNLRPSRRPALGADNDAILADLGYDAARIAQLRADKVI